MNNSTHALSEQIEHLVRAHIEATRQAAAEALDRAFSSALASGRPSARNRTCSTGPVPTKRTASSRRSPAELSALGERLHEAVCAHPGETMSVLAAELGETARELHRPMMALRRAGRVRSVGQRHQTRYFPTVPRS